MPELSSQNGQVSDYEPVSRTGRARWEEDAEGDASWPQRAGARASAIPAAQNPRAAQNFYAPSSETPHASSASTRLPSDTVESSAVSILAAQDKWIHKRGHSATYVGLFLFTLVLYFRPYEYLSVSTSMAFWVAAVTLFIYIPSQFVVEGTLTARPREVNIILLFALTGLLSIPLATNRVDSWAIFTDRLLKAVVMFVVMVNAVRTERRLKGLLLLTFAVSCVLSVNAINDYRLGRATTEGYRVAGSIGGMFSNPNYLALHLVTIIPLPLCLLLSTRSMLKKFVFAGIALLFLVATILTFSRGAFLALIGMTAVLLWKLGRRNRSGIAVLLLLFLPIVLVVAPGAYGNRIASIFDSSLDPNGSSTIRQAVFWRSVYVTIANPVFGVGIGNFRIMSIRELVSHNAYTQVSSEMGVAALALYTMFIVTPLRRLRLIERDTFASRRGSKFYYLSVALQASIVAYMIDSFFASVAYEWFIYYLVGYSVALRRIYLAQLASKAEAATEANKTADTYDESGRTLVTA
ncbi:MAG TPA: O-antigen ligase family protein [Pyrinomonadaceae bacterium]|jgi:O-antigen ligase